MLCRVWLPTAFPSSTSDEATPAHASFPRPHTETPVIPHDEVTNFGRTIPTTVIRSERVPRAHFARSGYGAAISHIVFSSPGGWYASKCVWETWEGASMRLEQSCFISEQNCKEKDLCRCPGSNAVNAEPRKSFLKRDLDHTWHSLNNTTASTC